MSVDVKICGLCDAGSVDAAVAGGAAFAGFVFFPGSRRVIDASAAADLIARIPFSVVPVGLFVDPSDDDIRRVMNVAPIRAVQLHGSETTERVTAVKAFTGLPVIKAIGVASTQDVMDAKAFESVADYLLFDAKPQGSAYGGQGRPFDWLALKTASFTKPWLLAGGLHPGNVSEAVAATGARILDVSSGVEDETGRKSPEKIKEFLKEAAKAGIGR